MRHETAIRTALWSVDEALAATVTDAELRAVHEADALRLLRETRDLGPVSVPAFVARRNGVTPCVAIVFGVINHIATEVDLATPSAIAAELGLTRREWEAFGRGYVVELERLGLVTKTGAGWAPRVRRVS